jgi:hypothetical protein
MKIKELEITLMSEKDIAFTFGADKIPFKRPFKALSLTYFLIRLKSDATSHSSSRYNLIFRRYAPKGYAQTSIRDISKATGLTIGNLYDYITKKEDVLRTVQFIHLLFTSRQSIEIFWRSSGHSWAQSVLCHSSNCLQSIWSK